MPGTNRYKIGSHCGTWLLGIAFCQNPVSRWPMQGGSSGAAKSERSFPECQDQHGPGVIWYSKIAPNVWNKLVYNWLSLRDLIAGKWGSPCQLRLGSGGPCAAGLPLGKKLSRVSEPASKWCNLVSPGSADWREQTGLKLALITALGCWEMGFSAIFGSIALRCAPRLPLGQKLSRVSGLGQKWCNWVFIDSAHWMEWTILKLALATMLRRWEMRLFPIFGSIAPSPSRRRIRPKSERCFRECQQQHEPGAIWYHWTPLDWMSWLSRNWPSLKPLLAEKLRFLLFFGQMLTAGSWRTSTEILCGRPARWDSRASHFMQFRNLYTVPNRANSVSINPPDPSDKHYAVLLTCIVVIAEISGLFSVCVCIPPERRDWPTGAPSIAALPLGLAQHSRSKMPGNTINRLPGPQRQRFHRYILGTRLRGREINCFVAACRFICWD